MDPVAKTPGGYVPDESFLFLVDTYYQDALKKTDMDDEERQVEFVCNLGNLCYQQGLYMMKDMIPKDRRVSMSDMMYESFQAAMNRYDIARQYLDGTYDIKLHPLTLFIIIRSTFEKGGSGVYNKNMTAAYDRLMKTWEEELKEAFGDNEVVDPEKVLPQDMLNENTMKEFFDTFDELKQFHRNRDEYATDKERELHDKIMTLYYALMKGKGD